MIKHRVHKNRGFTLLTSLVIASIVTVALVALASWFTGVYQGAKYVVEREKAFQIAEAGLDYYRWHLAKWPSDFKDGTGGPGPYIHDFEDEDGNIIGHFDLMVATSTNGSSIVTVTSEGHYTAGEFEAKRTLRARYAIPSLAKYAAVTNADIRFGEGTEVYGPVHSNGGIRFDGLAHNVVSSSLTQYNDPDHTGSNEHAVHTHVSPADPLPPTTIPSRPDVFEAGREVGVPSYSFSALTTSISTLRSTTLAGNGTYLAPSSASGYEIILKTDDTYDLYRVTSLTSTPSECDNQSASQNGWGTWSIDTKTLIGNYAFPSNGLIFVEDHVWVSGQVDGARLTIAAARFPVSSGNNRNIIVNNDLVYTNYDGTDAVALISQNHLVVGLESEDDLKIDAALVAQSGQVGRFYYAHQGSGNSACDGFAVRNSIELYGMIATNLRYGFAYTDDTGYGLRSITYDSNLLYNPPPFFPLASSQYETISWEELGG